MTDALPLRASENAARPAAAPSISLKPLMFQTFACSMAMMSFVAIAGPLARTFGLQPWHLGLVMTISGIGWMVMARIWGAASDRHGRRPILLFGLGGFTLAYLLLSLFIDIGLRMTIAPMLALAGLILGRGVAGIFYAAVPAATMALVADHVPAERRAAAMATVGAASAAGMVVGPGFAGLVAPFGLQLPLYATAALPIAAFFILWRILPRDSRPASPKRQQPRLLDPRLRHAVVVAFAAMLSVAMAQMTVGFFALDRLGLAPAQAASAAGIALALVGAALVCAQMVLRRLGWPPIRFIRIGAVVGGIGFASVMLATSAPMLWASFAVAALGMGWVYPSVSALAANAVEPHEQGAAAGSIGAAQGFGTVLGPIVGTVAYGIDNGLPYALTGALLLLTALWKGQTPVDAR